MNDLLTANGFASEPSLRVLNPNRDNYTALLCQPQGNIQADTAGVRNADGSLAEKVFGPFLELAVENRVDLAVAPEYSMPWNTIMAAVHAGRVPPAGCLWVLGAESTTLEELALFKEQLKQVATVIHEPMNPMPNRFLNPVVYIFNARTTGNPPADRIVMVVQFKTSPLGDKKDYEKNNMQPGSLVYVLGGGQNQLRLATLICSDAFEVTDEHASALYRETLLIHIQLNNSPRQSQFRQYRDKFFQYHGKETEILCLNWATGTSIACGSKEPLVIKASGSAWYLRPERLDNDDATIKQNHQKGLYYTWWKDSKCHSLFFSYQPAIFAITASKVSYHGVIASQAYQRGPILDAIKIWNSATAEWCSCQNVDDGFTSVVSICGTATAGLTSLAGNNPLYAERTLAICAGAITNGDWHLVTNLDSCSIDRNEIVCRVTACQDVHEDARRFRTLRLRAAQRLISVLATQIPASVADLANGFRFDWSPASPHTNVVSTETDGFARRATVIYLSDEHTAESRGYVAQIAADLIGQWATDKDQIVEGRQRICVWFRSDDGHDVQLPNPYNTIDQSHTESTVDYTREA